MWVLFAGWTEKSRLLRAAWMNGKGWHAGLRNRWIYWGLQQCRGKTAWGGPGDQEEWGTQVLQGLYGETTHRQRWRCDEGLLQRNGIWFIRCGPERMARDGQQGWKTESNKTPLKKNNSKMILSGKTPSSKQNGKLLPNKTLIFPDLNDIFCFRI